MEEYDEAKSTEDFEPKEFIRNSVDEDDASDSENFDVITMNANNTVAQKLQEENVFSNGIDNEQPEILSLQCAFKQIYQKRIKGIDNFPGLDNSEKNEEKLQVLRTYAEQLEEQNEVLVSTMMELEKEAQQRVVQMERRLKSSAKSTMEAVLNLHECEQEMRRLVTERLHIEAVLDSIQHQVSALKVENNFLRDQNFNLNHDIQALLHIIHHARTSGHWEMDCVTFCEVTPEQVFGPVQSMSQIHSHESVSSSCQLVKGVLDDSKLKGSSRQSSQRTSHSSTPSLGHQSAVVQMHDELNHLQFLQGEAHHELLEKNKTIASLEAQLSEVKHQLTLKEAECQCHLWEIETLRQQNKCLQCKKSEDIVEVLDDMLSEMQPVCDIMLKKSTSLPNLGSFRHHGTLMQRSLSYRTDLIIPQRRAVCMLKAEYLDLLRERRNKIKQQIERQPCRPIMLKSEFGTYFRRVYSEPLFFMYGDNIYVYRPCEPIQTEPSLALHSLHEDYRHGLAPCQSIDLKLPTEEASGPSLRVCEWDLIRGPQEFAIPEDSSVMPCHRVQISNSSSTSSDSEDMQCLPDIPCRMQESTGLCSGAYILQQCSSPPHHSHLHSRNSTSDFDWCENEASHESDTFHNHSCIKSSYRKNVMTSSSFVQTEEVKHPYSLSIGLQADLPKEHSGENIDITTANGHNGMDIGDIKKNLQMLKENLQRAEDKASSKEILIEQLQNHLQMAVKEVELKDTALENVERKLDASRHESMTLKKQITNLESEIQQLLGDLEDARMIHDNLSLNVEARKEQIEELRQQEQVLQDQKRSLMIQLDAQGDELEQAKKDLDRVKAELKECTIQIEQQTVIIQTLQEAVVQSKRAFDEVKQTTNHKPAAVPSSVLYTQNKPAQSPKCSVVDI